MKDVGFHFIQLNHWLIGEISVWEEIPETLRSAVRNGNLNLLLGAGTSMDAGLPGWKELLSEINNAHRITIKDQINELISDNRLLDAAQLLKRHLLTVS